MPSKIERVEAALSGESVDRVPVSLWGHDYRREWSARDLADATVDQFERYDWDYVKLNPRASYHVEDWGARYVPSGTPFDAPKLAETPIRMARDLDNLDLPRFDRGALAEHLLAIRLTRRAIGRETPLLHTIFCPLGILGYLVGDEAKVKEWLESDPRDVKTALEAITETFAAYARECLEAGATGIYYATTTWATRDRLTEDAYREFGTPYDRRILDGVADARFNVLHICGPNNLFDLFLDYPVRGIHWASRDAGNPTLDEGRDRLRDRVAILGGISHARTLPRGRPEDLEKEIRDAVERTDRYHFLLAPECSIPPETPPENRAAVREIAARL